MDAKANVQTAQIIPFPQRKELDLTFVNMVNEHAEMLEREKKAAEYSISCKRKTKGNLTAVDEIGYAISSLLMMGLIFALYILGCVL